MSANTDPTKGCAGKQRFESYSAADRIAKRSRRRNQTAFRVYHCRHCQGFHFGHHRKNLRIELRMEPA